jgi:hypothetical protein
MDYLSMDPVDALIHHHDAWKSHADHSDHWLYFDGQEEQLDIFCSECGKIAMFETTEYAQLLTLITDEDGETDYYAHDGCVAELAVVRNGTSEFPAVIKLCDSDCSGDWVQLTARAAMANGNGNTPAPPVVRPEEHVELMEPSTGGMTTPDQFLTKMGQIGLLNKFAIEFDHRPQVPREQRVRAEVEIGFDASAVDVDRTWEVLSAEGLTIGHALEALDMKVCTRRATTTVPF